MESATPHELALISAANQRKNMPLGNYLDFDVYREIDILISKGDVLRMTRNGIDVDKRRINNGQILSVMGFDKDGSLLLQNAISRAKYHLQKDFGHIDHAYCMTSHASQGKTVDYHAARIDLSGN